VNGYSGACITQHIATSHSPIPSGASPYSGEVTHAHAFQHCSWYLGAGTFGICRTWKKDFQTEQYINPFALGGTAKLTANTASGVFSGTAACALPTGPGHSTAQVFHIATGAPSIFVL
jgi:hypothetical protein